MKISKLIANLHEIQVERGDVEVFVAGGDDGVNKLEQVGLLRYRPAHIRDYFGETATDDQEKRLQKGAIRGLGKYYFAEESEPHEIGIYLGT